MHVNKLQIDRKWQKILEDEFEREYFKNLGKFVNDEYLNEKVYPKQKDIFSAFELCPFDKVKVVILGQDPYHGIGQANGLCFSVNNGTSLPPSLKNIFKEIESDLKIKVTSGGDLSRWARQGVLLLNATLTVLAATAGSHQKKGWEKFTDAVVDKLANGREHLVFMLWGNYAKNKGALINRKKHLVLESAHPSPFSAYNGFFGNKHFSKANRYLKENGQREIEWG